MEQAAAELLLEGERLQFGERPARSPTLGLGLDTLDILRSLLCPRLFPSRAREPPLVPLSLWGFLQSPRTPSNLSGASLEPLWTPQAGRAVFAPHA